MRGVDLRIVVLATAASGGGAMSILRDLHEHVSQDPGRHEWVFLLSARYLEEGPSVSVQVIPGPKKSWLHRLNFDVLTGGRFVRKLKPDLLLSLQDTLPRGLDCPTILYVHQVIPFQSEMRFSFWKPEERQLAVYQHLIGGLIKRSISHANVTVVQTEWMRELAIDQSGASPEQLVVIPPSVPQVAVDRSAVPFNPRLFVYPTTSALYKNIDFVYEACRLVGVDGYEDFRVELTIASGTPSPNVSLIGAVPREVILQRLSGGTLVFPSRVESYGLPLVEARALGVPVLAADLPYAREVLGGYSNSRFFDPTEPSELADLMKAVMNGELRPIESLGRCGPVGSSWGRLIEVIESVAR